MIQVLQAYTYRDKPILKLFFTSNHDENSWNGTEYEKYGPAAKVMAVFTHCWPGIPLLYSGQEIPNYKRLLFFDKDHLIWPANTPVLENFYTKLLHHFKSNTYQKDVVDMIYCSEKIIAFMLDKKKRFLVLFNFSAQDRQKIIIRHDLMHGFFENFNSGIIYNFSGTESFELQAWEYQIYTQTRG